MYGRMLATAGMSSAETAKMSAVVTAPRLLAAFMTSAVRPLSIACMRPTPPMWKIVAARPYEELVADVIYVTHVPSGEHLYVLIE